MTPPKTLTIDEKREIVDLYSTTPHTQKSLALIYGVTQSGISRVLLPASKARIAAYARCHPQRNPEPRAATVTHVDTVLDGIYNAVGHFQWPRGVALPAATDTFNSDNAAWPAGVIIPRGYYTTHTAVGATFTTSHASRS
ncbi:hypothetical protein T484DRAFT_1854947 [Baffinella frigidus]|nr:hypothetical protein T484DRAFT_1854947 [Cryptophyta sp. CCMP2293]